MVKALRKAERVLAVFGLTVLLVILIVIYECIKDGDRASWVLNAEQPRPFGIYTGSTGR